MGCDKALLPVDGVAMAARVAAALRDGGCVSVVAIGGDLAALDRVGLEGIADRWPGQGPLGGVVTALDHFAESAESTASDVVVIAACDLPRLGAATVAALVNALVNGPPTCDVALAFTDREQPVCAAWRPHVVAHLSAAFIAGERRLLDVLPRLEVVNVPVAAEQLLNVNTVGELPG